MYSSTILGVAVGIIIMVIILLVMAVLTALWDFGVKDMFYNPKKVIFVFTCIMITIVVCSFILGMAYNMI